MNEITTVPDSVSNAGYLFNYSLWTAGTVVTLVNVPWDSDYVNVCEAGYDYDGFINGQTNKVTVPQMKHARLNQPIRISTPFEIAAQYNYVRATNPAQPVAGSLPSTYYYFIKDVSYAAPNTTTLVLQLDVWATFINNVSFGRSFVDRGHAGIANENQMLDNGRSYLTIPEGFDQGGEMIIDHVYEDLYGDTRNDGTVQEQNIAVMVTSAVSLRAADYTNNEPKVVTAGGSALENLPNGGEIYFFTDLNSFNNFIFSNQSSAYITQGILSIQAIPTLDQFNVPMIPVDLVGMSPGNQTTLKTDVGSIATLTKSAAVDWTTDLNLPTRYAGLNKFKTYPYTMIEMTSYTGQPIVLKPESLPDRTLSYAVILHLNPGSGRLTFVPYNYNAGSSASVTSDEFGVRYDGGEWLDMACSISNFPMFSTMNNSYASYMASNKNQIAFSHNSARWDQTRAMMGAETAAQNATSGIMATDQTAQNQRQFNTQMLGTNLAHRTAAGVIDMTNSQVQAGQQVLGGNVLGGLISGVNGMTQAAASTTNDLVQMGAQTSHANQLSSANAQTSIGNQGTIRDNNYSLADQASRGDYSNAIAGIDARVQDMQMLQPTTSGQIGGESFNLAKLGWGVWFKIKRMQGAPLRHIGEHWLRYGYAVHAWMVLPQSLSLMSKFTYWKTLETTVRSNGCPEMYRMTIRGILEKGVTVWKNPNDIGMVDPVTNTALGGFSY